MNPTKRIMAVIDEKELDRIQTFCVSMDDWPEQQVLGKPLIPPKLLFRNPLSDALTKWIGKHSQRSIDYDIDGKKRTASERKVKKLKKILVDPIIADNLMMRAEAVVVLGFDGGHAFETTSNVDIAYEKKTHGNRYTIVGGMGVDHILTTRSTPEEVREAARNVITTCAPDGRFLLAMAHTHPELDVEKIKIMLEVAKDFGRYPIG